MRATPIILLILIVSLPLDVLAWLGQRLESDERTVIEQRFRGLLTAQMKDIDQIMIGHFANTQRELRRLARLDSLEPTDIRTVLRETPLVRQILVYSPNGDVLHPNPAAQFNSGERDFLLRAEDLVFDRDAFYAAGGKRRNSHKEALPENAPAGQMSREPATEREADKDDASVSPRDRSADQSAKVAGNSLSSEGWYTWYQNRGVHLVYWQRHASGHVVERSRWMSDLITTLPQTVDEISAEAQPVNLDSEIPASRIRLLDSAGRLVYQWGSYEPKSLADTPLNLDPVVELPFAEIPISSPLTSWRLQAFVPPSLVRDAGRSARFSRYASLVAATVVLGLLVALFWREYRRELREASQRVSFVN